MGGASGDGEYYDNLGLVRFFLRLLFAILAAGLYMLPKASRRAGKSNALILYNHLSFRAEVSE